MSGSLRAHDWRIYVVFVLNAVLNFVFPLTLVGSAFVAYFLWKHHRHLLTTYLVIIIAGFVVFGVAGVGIFSHTSMHLG